MMPGQHHMAQIQQQIQQQQSQPQQHQQQLHLPPQAQHQAGMGPGGAAWFPPPGVGMQGMPGPAPGHFQGMALPPGAGLFPDNSLDCQQLQIRLQRLHWSTLNTSALMCIPLHLVSSSISSRLMLIVTSTSLDLLPLLHTGPTFAGPLCCCNHLGHAQAQCNLCE